MIDIPGFDRYKYDSDTGELHNSKNKLVHRMLTQNTPRYKMKRTNGSWTTVAESRLHELAGLQLKIPDDAVAIKGADGYYIDEDSNIYSYSSNNPAGIVMQTKLGTKGYKQISIVYDTGRRIREVHVIMAETFIMEDYTKHGLVCLHADNDKLNTKLTNLSVGTYHKNNKDSYTDKLNPSKKGSIEHGILSRNRIDWSKIDLQLLIEKHNGVNTKIAKEVGCSDRTIKKQRLKFTK